MLTLHEVKTRFAEAVLQMAADEKDGDPDWTIGLVMNKTGLNEGQVRQAIKEFGLLEWNFDNFGYRSLAEMEAFVSIEPDPASHPLSEDRMTTTHEQMKHAVATALVAMREDARGGMDVPPTADEVVGRAKVHVGHVKKIMREDFGLQFVMSGKFIWTQEQYEAIEAYALTPIPRGVATVKSQVFNIGTNHGQVVAGDNHGDFLLTVNHHVEQIARAIDESPLPPEKKTEVKSKLAALVSTLGLEVVKAAVSGVTKGIVGGML